MWRKTATFWVVLFSLSLTLTLSSGQIGCPGKTVPEVLQSYDLPPGLFPDYVLTFKCTPVTELGVLSDNITITFWGDCKVSRQVSGVENVVECQREVSGTLSFRKLSNVKGITVKLTARDPPYGPFELRLNVTQVNVYQFSYFPKFIQFSSNAGVDSPPFPVSLFPPQPPKCDPAFASESKPVYDEFGHLLPPLVAA